MQLKTLWKQASERLSQAGVTQPLMDARLLLQHVLGISYEQLLMSATRDISAKELKNFDALISRREAREPVAVILERKPFWKYEFKTTKDTLDPRPDSETIITTALKIFSDAKRELRILDIGTGTGCLIISLLKEYPNATGTAVDISETALNVARYNAEALQVLKRMEFIHSPWDAIDVGQYDLILSNPPYIPSGDVVGLEPEVREFDPMIALDGGEDGLDAYRSLTEHLPVWLAPKGIALLEVGQGQAQTVERMMKQADLDVPITERDLAGIERVVVVRKKMT